MQYLAALWDDKAKRGPFPQLYTNDPKEAEEFIRNCDREGRTVVRCVGELADDAKERRIETIKSLSFLHGDIDLRELADVAGRRYAKAKSTAAPAAPTRQRP